MSEKFEIGDIVGIPELSSERFEIIGFDPDGQVICKSIQHRDAGERPFKPDVLTKLVVTRNATKKLR